jgi:predicted transcriptional regulator
MRMKTAISIPDNLFEAAERLAKRLGWSRSRLYARAVAAFVEKHRNEGVRERLDRIYGEDGEESRLDTVLEWIQSASLPGDDW